MVKIAARSAERQSAEGTDEVPASSSIVFIKMPKSSKD